MLQSLPVRCRASLRIGGNAQTSAALIRGRATAPLEHHQQPQHQHRPQPGLAPPRRWLSATAPSYRHLITFPEETSNPALDATLQQIRKDILHPSYLTPEERRKLNRPRYEAKLKNEPITLDIDGAEHKFIYRPLSELPSTRKLVLKAVSEMDTPDDWKLLPRLLDGMHSVAARKWNKPHDHVKITRIAARHGSIYEVIQCARQVDKTGFRLDQAELIGELLFYIQRRAYIGGWPSIEATRQAYRWVEQVVTLLQDQKHKSKGQTPPGQPFGLSLAQDFKWTGATLHLAAALVVKHGQETMVPHVETLAAELVARWPAAGKGLRAAHPPDPVKSESRQNRQFIWSPTGQLNHSATMISALDMAAQVLSATKPELAQEMRTRRDATQAEVNDILAADRDSKGNRILARRNYDLLFGTSEADLQGAPWVPEEERKEVAGRPMPRPEGTKAEESEEGGDDKGATEEQEGATA